MINFWLNRSSLLLNQVIYSCVHSWRKFIMGTPRLCHSFYSKLQKCVALLLKNQLSCAFILLLHDSHNGDSQNFRILKLITLRLFKLFPLPKLTLRLFTFTCSSIDNLEQLDQYIASQLWIQLILKGKSIYKTTRHCKWYENDERDHYKQI